MTDTQLNLNKEVLDKEAERLGKKFNKFWDEFEDSRDTWRMYGPLFEDSYEYYPLLAHMVHEYQEIEKNEQKKQNDTNDDTNNYDQNEDDDHDSKNDEDDDPNADNDDNNDDDRNNNAVDNTAIE